MNVKLTSEAQRFIDALVRSGEFQTADDVVAAAMDRLMMEFNEDLDDQTMAAIKEADEQASRGEVIGLDELKAQWNQRLGRSGQ